MIAYALAACLLGSLEARDGTIVVLQNSNPVVSTMTRSRVTHVAMIVNIANQPYVYEATPAAVRKLVLTEYCREIAELNRGRSAEQRVQLRLYSPARPYTEIERTRLRAYLESQVGRRYSVRGYVRDRPGDGIHCAELVSTALVRTGRYQFPPSYSISPVSLVAQIKPTHAVSVDLPTGEHRSRESWCHRSWAWWSGAFTWCSWACREFCTLWP